MLGRSDRERRWLVRLVGVLALWMLVGLFLIAEMAPRLPKSAFGWVLLLVVGPPVYVCGEWVASRLFSREAGVRISPAGFSLARIAVATAVTVGLLVLVMFSWWYLSRSG